MKITHQKGIGGRLIVTYIPENRTDMKKIKKMEISKEIDIRHSFGDKSIISIKIGQLFEECQKLNPGNHVCFNIAEEFDPTIIHKLQESLNDWGCLIKEYSLKPIDKNKIEVFCDNVDHKFC